MVVDIQDVTQLTIEECEKITELVERGVIFDALIHSEGKDFRVITIDKSEMFLYVAYSADIQMVDYDPNQ